MKKAVFIGVVILFTSTSCYLPEIREKLSILVGGNTRVKPSSDYYDASAFINRFFSRAGNNSFDGFTAISTLQSIVDNETYGYSVVCPGDGMISHYESGADVWNYVTNTEVVSDYLQQLTDEISINEVTFHFMNRICKAVPDGSFWSTNHFWSPNMRYKYDEKISIISYRFNLEGNAKGNEEIIANQMKTYLETTYNVKFSHELSNWGVDYNFASNDKMSFAIVTTRSFPDEVFGSYYNKRFEFFVAFNKKSIGNRLHYYFSGD